MNWIKFGHADRIAREGFRVIMPDLRAHGQSARPHGEEYYPKGILAQDLRELVGHIGLQPGQQRRSGASGPRSGPSRAAPPRRAA